MRLRVFAPLLACLLATACNQEPAAPAGASAQAVPVALWTAELSPVAEHIESVATLSAMESVTITARVSGKISAVHFDDGNRVSAGQLLVELDTTEPLARVREVEAALQEASLDLERLGSLGAEISTRAAIDIARANVAAQQARLAQAKSVLADHQLRAPFAGVLGFRQVSVGALITPGTVVAELDDLTRLKLDFTLPEVYLARLRVGDSVEARSPAWPGESFAGTVRNIDTRVDPVTRAVMVRGLLDNADGRLLPGMLMTVDLLVGEEQALVLPEQALIQKGQESYVYAVDDESRAYMLPVQIERRVKGGVVIDGGLAPGQVVVVRGQLNLRPGVPVKEVAAQAMAAAAGTGDAE
ncbi:efflux RND transporter periplasmic adaptor subunit [Haliea sp. E17]|uniref:efflux RND transporter periplasmic adaptor subunit n=1 Tax=Haliea sp. E17 TaxID=3401576 RepID=UPI003AAC7667